MRHIFLSIGVAIISMIAYSQTYLLERTTPDFAQPPLKYIPDSIKKSLENKNFIFYSEGYHAFPSSIIMQDSCRYVFHQWTTSTHNDCAALPFDTTAFVTTNKGLIEWGLDSIVNLANAVKPHFRKYDDGDGWFPHPYTTLYINNCENGVFYLHSNELVEFYGVNDSIFNSNIVRLEGLMWWLSIPRVRSYWPEGKGF